MLSFSAALSAEQHLNHQFLFEQEFDLHELTSSLEFLQQPSELVDSLDLRSVPSLMSPDPSLRDTMSDSVEDEDEDMDVYDIFTTPQNTSQSQPQGFAGYSLAQPQQRQQQPSSTTLPLDQHANTSLPQYAPNAPPYYVPGAERFVPLPEQFSDLASLGHYVSSLQRQRPALESTIPLDQEMDLMISSLTLSSPPHPADASLLQQLANTSANTTASGESSVQSPSLSWTSAPLSRETSPTLSPHLQRRQVSYSVPSSTLASPSVTDLSAPLDLASGPSSPSASATASPRRRRRVRPPTVKKPKKIRPSIFPCPSPACDKVFSRAYNLTSHMKTHSNDRPFLCGMCPLAFARRHDRERHVRLHTGEKPYPCDICGAGFMRNDALHRHQKLCGIAGSSFAHFNEPSWQEDPRSFGGSGGQGPLAGSTMAMVSRAAESSDLHSTTADLTTSTCSSSLPPLPSTVTSNSPRQPLAPASSGNLFSPTSLSPDIAPRGYRSNSPTAVHSAHAIVTSMPISTAAMPNATVASVREGVGAPICGSRRPSPSGCNNNHHGSRSRNTSPSTPPPSPPLAAAEAAPAPSLTRHTDLHTDEPVAHPGSRPVSPSQVSAAAAAAAASYTSQELAIAYSMVTSTQEEEEQQQKKKKQQQQQQQQQRLREYREQKLQVNRFPFGIPPLSAKLDQVVPPADGNDALSSLWKRSAPPQEPYFRTRHAIASQHTLSTMGGVLFSLDEVPKEFNEDMYIAMRNRIFELEAKTVNYAPFNRSRKRPVDIMDDYPIHPHSRHGHGYGPSGYHGSHRYGHEDEEGGHYSKRTAYQQPTHPHHAHHGPSSHGTPHENYVYRPQVRQLQYLRQRTAAAQAAASVSIFTTPQPASAMGHGTPGTPIADKVDRPVRPKPTRPLECSNCLALDSLTWRPKIDIPPSSSSPSSASASDTHASEGSTPTTEGKLLCPACMQYWQAHGKCRPVPPYRTNFLKKIHCRFKKELQEVRFQGWQDAQVIEFDDRMSEREFHAVFKVLPGEDMFGMRSRQTSVSSHHNNSGAPTAASSPVLRSASTTAASGATDSPAAKSVAAAPPVATAESAEGPVVIKIEDDDDEQVAAPLSGSAPAQASTKGDKEELAFQSEAAVGDLFGHRWKTEPMVGYTLVHFGGSDRTRMVPMNPTVPSLTVMFNATTESVTFTFRVLVNGLCLLSSGGGPPALHMPEMADDEPSEGEEEEEEQALLADAATESQEDESDQPMTEPSHHGHDKSSPPVTGEPNEAPTTTTMDVDVPISV
ncbi:hypothetical protein KVV02_002535 [Mortierella alpina]|uniref:C2H2-type domain-containing protein n=1 Tax=Mortierella alpina TaxID=64518 RepID=A0A9P8A5X0_MORAP|nr:hypothetical protein KVV02_002535 [Mortierella alpina]